MKHQKQQTTILVVDDEAANLGVLFEHLGQAGFTVLIAEDGASALRRVEWSTPDIILLDIKLPDIDGFELCRQLKAQPQLADKPFIFLTALDKSVDIVKGFDLSAVDYITKPFRPEEVVARVRKHLMMQHLRQQLEVQNAQLQQEIAERKRMEAELHQTKDLAEAANRAKSEFLAHISHELRTPLHVILGMAQVMKQSSEMSREHQECLQSILRSGNRLLLLINRLIKMSKQNVKPPFSGERMLDVDALLTDVNNKLARQHADWGGNQEEEQLILTSSALAELPEDLRTRLQEATETADIDSATNLIEQIHQQNAPLAETLTELLKNYRFDILQEWFEEKR